MKKIYFALTLAAVLTACSEEFNPDVDYKGEIEDNYLTQLEQGEASATFRYNKNETRVYTRTFVDSVGGKWSEVTGTVAPMTAPDYFDLYQGKSWIPYVPSPKREEQVLFEPEIEIAWKEYISKTGFDTTECIVYPVVYDVEAQKIQITEVWYTVERANNQRLLLSINKMESNNEEVKNLYTYYQPDYMGSWNAQKWDEHFGKMQGFNTPEEIILNRIDLMKIFNKENPIWKYNPKDTDYRHLNLDLIKELILEGKTEDEVTNNERILLFGSTD
ncbi:MAG: membrane lipoprotein lipid attachment site-containing protein [Muribaculaceae bacterium]|nr:membrane lipoprotein lipid attachment site-containing protein [Muribaculaceae bacterium]